MRSLLSSRDPQLRRLDASIVLLVAVLSLATLAVPVEPTVAITDARAIDIAINVSATLVGGAVAILAWIRWRESRAVVALYESGAFVALTVVNALTVAITLVGRDAAFGLSPAAPAAAPVYLWTLTRLSAAAFLVAGAVRGLRRTPIPVLPAVIALVPPVILMTIAVLLLATDTPLPTIPSITELGSGASFASEPAGVMFALVQLVVVALHLAGAVLFRQLYLRDRVVSHAFLAGGLVVAAFSQLHFAIQPVVANGIVTSTDILRLLFHAILFMGIQAELESDLSALRRANAELRRLRDVDASNAALGERTRLAREIHDGLAQDLWFAKLKQGRVVQAELDDETRETARDVLTSIDAALADARQAVMALRIDPTAGEGLIQVLRSYVDDFADRFGLRAEFTADPDVPRLPSRTEAEVLRIVQEAMNNTRKHADATLVRVHVACEDGRVRVSVSDNGRGFDPDQVPEGRFGLQGMVERAGLVGGSLEIHSRPQDGTRVAVDVATEPGS